MRFVLFLVAVYVVYRLVRRRSSAGPPLPSGSMDCHTLLQRGVQAAGILVRVGTQRSLWGTAKPGYYEVRSVSLAVEIPGRAPYQCECALFVPANLRRLVMPGATVELRVDPRAPANIALFGPGVGLPFLQ